MLWGGFGNSLGRTPLGRDPKKLTKRTLCGIVLFKLNTFLVMFLCVPSIDSMCFLHR